MSKFVSKNFGEIDLARVDEVHEGSIKQDGREIEVMIFVDDEPLTAEYVAAADALLGRMDHFNANNLAAIRADYTSGGQWGARLYVQHHLDPEVVAPEELEGIVDFNNKAASPEEQMLQAFHLRSIAFHYHGQTAPIAVCDYTIDADLTDYIMAVSVNGDGQIIELSMES